MVRQKKKLSQVFLKDPAPCHYAADTLALYEVEHVLEIGPGAGILTRALLEQGFKVSSVEFDSRFAELLKRTFAKEIESGRFEIICQDFLTFDLASWIENKKGKLSVCGNIPYHLSSAILTKVLPCLEQLSIAYFLTQLEFAERVAAPHGTSHYGSLSVYAQLRAECALDAVVPKELFKPVPKVDSAFIALKPLREKESDELLQTIENISKTAFSKRRKKLSNALSDYLIDRDISTIPIDLSLRPDALSPHGYVNFAKWFLETK